MPGWRRDPAIRPGRLIREHMAVLGLQLAVVAGLGVEVAAAAITLTCGVTNAVVKGTKLMFAQVPADLFKWLSAWP